MLGFSVVSAIGLSVALATFWLLADQLRADVKIANLLADTFAVLLVFFMSKLAIFPSQKSRSGSQLIAWVIWQVIHISVISSVLLLLSQSRFACPALHNCPNVFNKVAIAPVTVGLNFLAMKLITSSKAFKKR